MLYGWVRLGASSFTITIYPYVFSLQDALMNINIYSIYFIRFSKISIL